MFNFCQLSYLKVLKIDFLTNNTTTRLVNSPLIVLFFGKSVLQKGLIMAQIRKDPGLRDIFILWMILKTSDGLIFIFL